VNIEDLAVAHELAPDGGRNVGLLMRAHVREDRMSLLGRRRQGRHFPDASDGQLERAGNGRGRHREHVDVCAHRLERLLVLDAKTLLLVDDDKAEFLEPHRAGDEAMRADDKVDRSVRQPLDDLLGFLVGLESRQRGHLDGERGEALGEGVDVLLDQQRRGAQDRDLGAILDGLEGGPHRDFGLAEAHVATHEPVHRDGLLHVGLDLVPNSRPLVAMRAL